MNRDKRRRRLQVKMHLERLETRWLMRAGVESAAAVRRIEPAEPEVRSQPDPVTARLEAEMATFVAHHPDAAAHGNLKQQRLVVERLGPASAGAWGALRLSTGFGPTATSHSPQFTNSSPTDSAAGRRITQSKRSGAA